MNWTRAIRSLWGRQGRPSPAARAAARRRRTTCRPAVECLEDRLTPAAQLSVFAGGGTIAASTTPTPATQVHIVTPLAPVVDHAGDVFFADFNNDRVEKVGPAGNLVVIAGGGTTLPSNTPIPALQALIKHPSGLALDKAGNLYVVDSTNNLIDRIDTAGNIVAIAGGGTTFPSTTPIPARQAELNTPESVVLDAFGNIYVTDSGNARLEKIDTAGNLVVIAGGGTLAPSTTPIAATQALIDPTRVAVDGFGNLYITDLNNVNNQLVERIDTAGHLVVIAGGGTATASTTPTPATQVKLNAGGVVVDGSGNVLIADDLTMVIDRVDTAGKLTVVAGGGATVPTPTPINASQAAIVMPFGLAIDGSGNLYVADADDSRREVYKITGLSITPPAPVVPPPAVSIAFGPNGAVVEVVSSTGVLTQYDSSGVHVIGGGVRSASAAFGPSGFTMLVTFLDGTLKLFDAHGITVMGGGILSASVGFGPNGSVIEVVRQDGSLFQYDAGGVHFLGTGARSASVAFNAAGGIELLVVAQDGTLRQFDASGVTVIGGGVESAGIAFSPTGSPVIDVIFANMTLLQFSASGTLNFGKIP